MIRPSLIKHIFAILALLLLAGCAGPGHRHLPYQLGAEDNTQPVVSIQGYIIRKSTCQRQLTDEWEHMAEIMSSKPGFISAELNQGSGRSRLWIEISHWESAESLRTALESTEVQEQLQRMPKTRFNHLFIPQIKINPTANHMPWKPDWASPIGSPASASCFWWTPSPWGSSSASR
ncbi:hypothetical protein CKO35_02530 [Ectothiorhodospira shaposhnikovii]|uniref:antibiotic biosynthesis monooxygenase family protein n=1 Tax=Ectothiorhodospira shaposhnikovii TaxID=1054 RepID=UPI003B8A8323|nr:hypothetical protein [Ectothiorhodospira shaposhnikovii]